MNPLLYLILAHLLADYPLQVKRLAVLKQKYWLGTALHGLVHFGVAVALLYPFLGWISAWVVLGAVALSHALIDQAKIVLTRKHGLPLLLGYVTDQLLHFLILFVASVQVFTPLMDQIQETPSLIYTSQSVAVYLSVLILCTYAYDVTRWTYRASRVPESVQPYRRDYKMIVRNGFLVTLAFALYWMMG